MRECGLVVKISRMHVMDVSCVKRRDQVLPFDNVNGYSMSADLLRVYVVRVRVCGSAVKISRMHVTDVSCVKKRDQLLPFANVNGHSLSAYLM